MNKCIQCNTIISDKAKYCSDKCRMAFTRTNKIVQPEQIQPEHEQMTPNKQPKQIDERIGKVIKGYCHGCGRDFTKIEGIMKEGFMSQETANNRCICYHCTKAGITHATLGLNMAKCDY